MKYFFSFVFALFIAPNAMSQKFIFYEDSIAINGYLIRKKTLDGIVDSEYMVKNLTKLIGGRYKRQKESRGHYKLKYTDWGITIYLSHRINERFKNAELVQMKFWYNISTIDTSTEFWVCGHVISENMNFASLIKDDFWKRYADSTFYDKYRLNNVIYVDCDFCNNYILLEFENIPPYKIHCATIGLAKLHPK